jgi:hypothetical protein
MLVFYNNISRTKFPYFPNTYYHTSLRNFEVSGASVAPASLRYCGLMEFNGSLLVTPYVCSKFHEGRSAGSETEMVEDKHKRNTNTHISKVSQEKLCSTELST